MHIDSYLDKSGMYENNFTANAELDDILPLYLFND